MLSPYITLMFLVLSGIFSVSQGNHVLLDGVVGLFGVRLHLRLFRYVDPVGAHGLNTQGLYGVRLKTEFSRSFESHQGQIFYTDILVVKSAITSRRSSRHGDAVTGGHKA